MTVIGGIDLGNLTDYLFFFADGSTDANWQGATKGFVGDVAVDGIQASEGTSGSVPYAGTISTNDATLGAWQDIVDQNDPPEVDPAQAFASTNNGALITGLESDLANAFTQINALTANPGDLPAPFDTNFDGTIQSLDGLDTQNGTDEVFVLDITSNFSGISTQISITGDAGDVFIFRWDTDGDPSNGYQGQVKFQSGGAIVPGGGLVPSNFINVAGDINASGGGSTPPPPYPQGPRFDDGTGSSIVNGSDFSGGGFFTGYWLTTGDPTNGETQSLSNGIFVGGWYTTTTKFSMTSGTSGVYVSPNEATLTNPNIDVEKEVSNDNGTTWFDADDPPGPNVVQGTAPQFRFTVTNTGNVTLTNVVVSDDVFGQIATIPSLAPGESQQFIQVGTWVLGQQVNTATATGDFDGQTVSDTDPAHWVGVEAPTAAIDVEKEVSPDNGATWFDADNPPGPDVVNPTNPQFRFTVTNTGNVTLTNVEVTDDVFGQIATIPSLAPGASQQFIVNGTWAQGQQVNTATATGDFDGQTVSDTDPAYWVGVEAQVPAIDVEKEVSNDNGTTWFDADNPPGPDVVQGTNPQFRFTVTNTGNVTLSNVQITDDVSGLIATIPSLAPGASQQFIVNGTWALGQQVNTATTTGDFDGATVSDTDPAHWVGVEAPTPDIDVVKEVSPDNGTNWFDADNPPGPEVVNPTNPQFRFTVTNTGNVTLTNVEVTDDVFGQIATIPSLAPGASQQFIVNGTWASGQQVNTATATGEFDGQTVSDTDPAHWVGVEEAVPSIDVVKEVSPDNGATWFDADNPPGPNVINPTNPQFRFTVINTGNVTLSNVQVTDDVFGLIAVIPSLAAGASQQFIQVGTWAPGQQMNTATATGEFDGQTVTDTDPANWFGADIAIDIVKEVSVDNGATWIDANTSPGPTLPEGVTPQFRYTVTNTGNVSLTNLTLEDSNLGNIPIPAGNDPLDPGQSFSVIAP
ncbi:DUF7507 domain-containing protein [Acetohalobium arabaticum]|uniref:Conserved repeat domain protein n=1 Tax=Acetohalobium arabaticum (strain ATCC 49924 / DSM 5501 / Z-7288) TaxID=574087 RepID=D9QQ69_ACEAZ|nr:hypothetical protein [Acetohalobium arabaticum]ADL12660.1 conserved repeat domain protein [Acetohalobium arabaticum DSM 5501]